MSQRYRLVKIKNMGKDQAEVPEKFHAYPVNNGYVSFDELCVDISEGCTLTSADVKAVMDRMNYELDKHLRSGRIVQFGEIGNFRLSLGSSGSVTEKDFQNSQIRTPKVVFTPGKRLQTARHQTRFEKVSEEIHGGEEGDNVSGNDPGQGDGNL